MTLPISEYRLLVTGSREWTDLVALGNELWKVWSDEVMRCPGWNLVVVHGACPSGADLFASQWAKHMHKTYLSVREEPHPADWETHGKKAGFIRNAEMVDLGADQCLAFYHPGAANRGTHDTAMRAKAWGIPVRAYGKPSEEHMAELAMRL